MNETYELLENCVKKRERETWKTQMHTRNDATQGKIGRNVAAAA